MKKTYEQIVVELITGFFDCHDHLRCCKNKRLTEGTFKRIKENAETMYKRQDP